MAVNKLTPVVLSILLLFGCSADSKPTIENPKNNLEKPISNPNKRVNEQLPQKEKGTIVIISEPYDRSSNRDDGGIIVSDAASLSGKLIIIDNCLLIESGDPKQPTYNQPMLSGNDYVWDETRKVLIHKIYDWDDSTKATVFKEQIEYPIGSEIRIGGGGIIGDTDKFRKKYNIPKCHKNAGLFG